MKYLVDIGNSAIKWAAMQDGQIQPMQRMPWREQSLSAVLEQNWLADSVPSAVIVSSVAKQQVGDELRDWCRQHWQLEPVFVRSTAAAAGVRNAYRQPEQLGVDRWAAMIAAHQLSNKAVCVADCGTALTIDVVDAGGQHLGGLIIPGLDMMRDALLTGTAIQQQDAEQGHTSLFACNTTDAIQGGVLYTTVAALDRIFQDVDNALEPAVDRIITGGSAEKLLPLLQGKVRFYPDLVLRGLAALTQEPE